MSTTTSPHAPLTEEPGDAHDEESDVVNPADEEANADAWEPGDDGEAEKPSVAKKRKRCKECGKRFVSKSSLAMHMRVHTDQRPFKCKTCDATFKRPHHLARHNNSCKSFNRLNPFVCEHCSKRFYKKAAYEAHLLAQHEENKFKCTDCDQSFSKLSLMKRHRNCEHPKKKVNIPLKIVEDDPIKKPHKCRTCGKRFSCASNMARHELVHAATFHHACPSPKCGKRFSRADLLASHQMIHTGEKPYACKTCGRRFRNSGGLYGHEKRVHAVKSHACQHCTELFSTEQKLARHARLHDTDRRFQCHECGKAFTNSCNLDLHVRIHTQERQYICEHCGTSFIQKHHLLRHVETHTRLPSTPPKSFTESGQSFACTLCGRCFPKYYGLVVHRRIKHGMKTTKTEKTSSPVSSDHELNAGESDQWRESVVPNESPSIVPNTSGEETLISRKKIRSNMQAIGPATSLQSSVPPIQNLVNQPTLPSSLLQCLGPPIQTTCEVSDIVTASPYQMHDTGPVSYETDVVTDGVAYDAQGDAAPRTYQVMDASVPITYEIQEGEAPDGVTVEDEMIECVESDAVERTVVVHDARNIILSTDNYETILYFIEAARASGNPVICADGQATSLPEVLEIEFDDGCGETQVSSSPKVTKVRSNTKRRSFRKNGSADRPYSCEICGSAFAQSGVLVKHLRTHTGEKPYKCQYCDKAFAQITNLKRHTRSHRGEKPYMCDLCNKTFSRSEKLLYHLKVHTDDRPFVCSLCPKRFISKEMLRRHRERRHAFTPKRFACSHPGCSKSYASIKELSRHHLSHGPKTHVCNVCSRAFVDAPSLERHTFVHSTARPYRCNQCTKSYSLPQRLTSHVKRVHNPDDTPKPKNYGCQFCCKRFKEMGELVKHERSHNGERPFKCDQCEKSFTIHGNLTIHQRIHSGVKPFSCAHCPLQFRQRHHLQRHGKVCEKNRLGLKTAPRKAKKTTTQCDICEKKVTMSNLKKHIATQHDYVGSKSLPDPLDEEVKVKEETSTGPDVNGANDETENVLSQYLCEVCGMESKNEDELSCGHRRFTCGTCGTRFESRHHLSQHERLHTGEKIHKCSQCDVSYSMVGRLNTHIEKCHGLKSEPVEGIETTDDGPESQKSQVEPAKTPVAKTKAKGDKRAGVLGEATPKRPARATTKRLMPSQYAEDERCSGESEADDASDAANEFTEKDKKSPSVAKAPVQRAKKAKKTLKKGATARKSVSTSVDKLYQCIDCGAGFALKSEIARHSLKCRTAN